MDEKWKLETTEEILGCVSHETVGFEDDAELIELRINEERAYALRKKWEKKARDADVKRGWEMALKEASDAIASNHDLRNHEGFGRGIDTALQEIARLREGGATPMTTTSSREPSRSGAESPPNLPKKMRRRHD